MQIVLSHSDFASLNKYAVKTLLHNVANTNFIMHAYLCFMSVYTQTKAAVKKTPAIQM